MKYILPFTNKIDTYENFKWRMSTEYQRSICDGCNGVSVEHTGDPFDIVVRREPKIFDPLHPGAAILTIGYAEFIKSHDPENRIVWGRVLVGKNRLVSERYVTAYMPTAITLYLRGDERSVYYVCKLCGSIRSSMHENGNQYFLEHKCNYDVLFVEGRCGPYLSDRIVRQYNWELHPEVKFETVPVLDCPEDGFRLPGDPDWSTTYPDFKLNTRKRWDRQR